MTTQIYMYKFNFDTLVNQNPKHTKPFSVHFKGAMKQHFSQDYKAKPSLQDLHSNSAIALNLPSL